MHTTIVTLKTGEVVSGSMGFFRPALNWFKLWDSNRKFYFDDCEAVVTLNQRVSINSPLEGETCDEMKRAKKDLDWGREKGWTETDEERKEHPYPKEKFAWEKRYEV